MPFEKHNPEQEEEEVDESDSCPSCDNFELDEFKENFTELLADDDVIKEYFSEEEKIQEEKTIAANDLKPTSALTIVKELPS